MDRRSAAVLWGRSDLMTNLDNRTSMVVDGLADSRPPEPRRKVFIKSFGCQMNAYDARRMADVLAPSGFDETGAAEDADLVILNTCHIRERAAEKVFSELGKLRDLKRERAAEGHPLTLAVAGCVAQAEGDEILRRQPAVDLVVGPQSYHRLPTLVAASRSAPAIDTDFPAEPKFAQLPLPTAAATRARGLSAFVTIQEGCDKFCTFCVVPYTRGAEFSRPAGDILAEVRALAAAGVREVSLLGQNVNAYHGAGEDGAAPWGLARLAAAVAAVPGICRIRYTTSHPTDMDEALLAAHRNLPALMPFLHLPVQTGSDRLLAAMNRRHTAADYRDLIARVRAARPDIALSSDFIVGYPGETEDDFQATLRLIADVGFASTFFFKYSPRAGTPAARAADQIDEDIKRDRLARLQAVVEPQRHAFNAACVGRTMPVLFEKAGRHPGQVVGKSPYLQPVQVEADLSVVGQEREVLIVGLGSNSLYGRLDQPAVRSLELAS